MNFNETSDKDIISINIIILDALHKAVNYIRNDKGHTEISLVSKCSHKKEQLIRDIYLQEKAIGKLLDLQKEFK
jgi:hypothetical protein